MNQAQFHTVTYFYNLIILLLNEISAAPFNDQLQMIAAIISTLFQWVVALIAVMLVCVISAQWIAFPNCLRQTVEAVTLSDSR